MKKYIIYKIFFWFFCFSNLGIIVLQFVNLLMNFDVINSICSTLIPINLFGYSIFLRLYILEYENRSNEND